MSDETEQDRIEQDLDGNTDEASEIDAQETALEEIAQNPEQVEPDVAAEPAEQVEPDAVAEPVEAAETTNDSIETAEEPAKPRSRVPWWPFWILAGSWVVLCASAAYFLTRDATMPSVRQEAYTFIVAVGLALTVLGPILAIVVWAFSRSGVAKDQRTGMFGSSLMRAATITLVGVIAWVGVLIMVDALRLGLVRF